MHPGPGNVNTHPDPRRGENYKSKGRFLTQPSSKRTYAACLQGSMTCEEKYYRERESGLLQSKVMYSEFQFILTSDLLNLQQLA